MSLSHKNWNLEITDNTLAWDGVPLNSVADEYGTPCFVAGANRLDDNADNWISSARSHSEKIRSYFSFKTCPAPALLGRLRKRGFGVEAVAAHEIELAARAGFRGEEIIFGGTGRKTEDFRIAGQADVGLIILDTPEEVALLAGEAEAQDQPREIGLRIIADVNPRGTARINKTSLRAHHFGFDPKSEEFAAAVRICGESRNLKLTALHSHIGTGLRDIEAFRRNFEKLADLFEALRRRGFPMSIIDVGGGLAVSTVKEFSALEFLKYAAFGVMPKAPKIRDNRLVESYMAALADAYKKRFGGGADSPLIYLEPGRVITSDAILLLVRVSHVRRRANLRIAVTDGGALSTGMSVLGEYHEAFSVRNPTGARDRKYTIVGKIPTPLDILYRNKPMPELQSGDLLAVMDAGAYMIATATNFATLRASIVLLDRGKMTLLRKRETARDLLSREVFGD